MNSVVIVPMPPPCAVHHTCSPEQQHLLRVELAVVTSVVGALIVCGLLFWLTAVLRRWMR